MANSIIDLNGSIESQTLEFLKLLFEWALDEDYGVVEIVTVDHLNNSKRTFFNKINALINYAGNKSKDQHQGHQGFHLVPGDISCESQIWCYSL